MAPTATRARPSVATRGGRWRTLARAWAPSTRALPLGVLAAAMALASLPTLLEVTRGGSQFTGALGAAVLVVGGALAFAVEDHARETLSASPTTLARRHALRLSAVALVAATTLAVLWLIAATSGTAPATELRLRAAELAAAGGVALAVASTAQRRGAAQATQIGAVAGPMGALVVSALAYRLEQLPAILAPQHHDRWWVVAALAWAVALWSWRDPGR